MVRRGITPIIVRTVTNRETGEVLTGPTGGLTIKVGWKDVRQFIGFFRAVIQLVHELKQQHSSGRDRVREPGDGRWTLLSDELIRLDGAYRLRSVFDLRSTRVSDAPRGNGASCAAIAYEKKKRRKGNE